MFGQKQEKFNPVKRILGDRISKNNYEKDSGFDEDEEYNECFVCGSKKPSTVHGVHLHDYGVRKYKRVPMCKSCIKAEKEGVL